MRVLGHERFCLAGHDRGTYVAQRLALDSPGSVRRLCLMEGIPIAEALARCDARFAASWYHWFFFGQTDKPAERFISADPQGWYTATAEHMGAEAFEDYRRAIHNPETVHAMMEDYRAGLGIDREHDDADRAAGRRIGDGSAIHRQRFELAGALQRPGRRPDTHPGGGRQPMRGRAMPVPLPDDAILDPPGRQPAPGD